MTDSRKEVRQALDIYKRRETFDTEQLERAVKLLASHNLWSMAQVSAISGATKPVVYRLMTKEDHTGGRFNPETLDLILEEIELKDRNETNRALTAKILSMGTSSYMLGKLIGQPVASVKWRAASWRKTQGAFA